MILIQVHAQIGSRKFPRSHTGEFLGVTELKDQQ